MGFILGIVALVLFILAGLEVDLGGLAAHQVGWFGLASLTGALLLGLDRTFFGRSF